MKKRFIILIDFSDYSANLLKYAYDWSEQMQAELLLVHQTIVVAPVFTDSESKTTIKQHTTAVALEKLKVFSNAILPVTAIVSFSVSSSHLQITIRKLLAQPFENLIFVGLKGTGLLKKIFIGSTAIRVIDHANNLVVAMPKDVSKFSPEKIFVAVSDKYPLNILAFNKFLDFVGKGIERITFFYLAKPGEDKTDMESQLRDIANLFAERYNTSFAVYEGNDAFEHIKTVINDKIEEILVIQKGSRIITDQIFRKFLINELVYEGHTPLLVLP